jgi:hypothetical protein
VAASAEDMTAELLTNQRWLLDENGWLYQEFCSWATIAHFARNSSFC